MAAATPNKQADHIANMTILHQKSFSHRDEDLIAAVKSGYGNVVAFSDGGFWDSGGGRAGGWLALALGGMWGEGD